MPKRCRLLGLIVVLALTAGATAAVNLPFMQGPLAGQDGPEAVDRPQPADLQPNWWRYLQVPDEELAPRVEEIKQHLQDLLAELPEGMAARALPQARRVASNLDALAQARRQFAAAPPSAPIYEERYTVGQLLEILVRLAGERPELEAGQEDLATLERTVAAEQQRIDTLMAAYLGLPAEDPERALRGLEIMAERTALGLAEERLRVDRAAFQAHATRVGQLESEMAVGAGRLMATTADLERLDNRLAEARAALAQAEEQLIRERSKALSVLTGEGQDKATGLYRQQWVVHAAVEEATARVRLITLEARRQLIVLLLDTEEADGETILRRVAGWTGQLAEIRREAAGWAAASAREQSRVSDRMAGGPAVFDLAHLINQDRLDLVQKTLVTLQSLDLALQQAELVLGLVTEVQNQRDGRLWDWLTHGQLVLRQLWRLTTDWLSQSLFKLGDTPVTAMGLVRVALILFCAWWLSYWWRRALARLGERREGVNQASLYTVGRLSHYVIILLGLILGLASIGVDFTNFALLASAMAIGMGFGLQSIVSNFVSGLILLFERSLKVGDFVELTSGIEGEVREINVRSTLINTNDNVDVVVPNSEFINTKLINWTLQENYRRIHVPFRVAFGTDIDLVTEAALEAAERVPHTMTIHRAGVWVVDFGENGLEFELVVWIRPDAVKRPGAVKAAYKKEIARALYRHGIEVPVPQRDLRLRAKSKERKRPRRRSAML